MGVEFDSDGNMFVTNEDAQEKSRYILNHPDVEPVLIVGRLNGEIGVSAYGEPTEEVAQLLDHIATTYRKALHALTRRHNDN
jgi:hypothetical protein